MASKQLASICLDASSILKTLVEEKESEILSSVLKAVFKNSLTVIEPSLAKIEIYSTIRKKVAFSQITRRKAFKALSLFQEFSLQYLNEETSLLTAAYNTACRLNLTVIYDCIYLELARLQRAYFLTSDSKFLNCAKKVYTYSYSPKELLEKM
jgi:predicted nucleic acid-binding protein